ncbi:restriction endonuclease subunit M [Micromonospora aurantiaca (nom. illeg.)]|uniref:restriction endonuclease subunit M n=1 Tax=Micromonospora aurantiaca (nom. illeg.) TaxID=47850 RepID=UPI003F49C5CF
MPRKSDTQLDIEPVEDVSDDVLDGGELEDLAPSPEIVAAEDATQRGYLIDYVSKQRVRATPEEVDAVQVFSQRLVEDFGYPIENLQTRPQFRVRMRPSDERRSYPVDIAVFRSDSKVESELYMIVECKKKNRSEGQEQLRLYLDMSPAELGVWFNGSDHLYLQKIHHADGSRTYKTLPSIPRYGQRVEDIGLYRRKDLSPRPSNLKAIFRDLRNHLAGMTTGVTRDEPLARNIINILFCKIYDEQNTRANDIVRFRAGVDEPTSDVQARILDLFEDVKSIAFEDVFSRTDTLDLDAASLAYVVGELQNYEITSAERDAIGDAFETFIGPALRGSEGQFFTPRNVVRMLVEMINPRPGEKIIDPACGSGGFLITSLGHVWSQLRADAETFGWSDRELARREQRAATDGFRGVDKDSFLAQVTKAYMALVGDGRGGIFCANTLSPTGEWPTGMTDKVRLGSFDVVLSNPPFGKKIVVRGQALLSQYKLGYRWRRNPQTNRMEITSKLHDKQPPQVIFLERCLQLLKPGGRLGIVLPESIFGMPTHEYVVEHLRTRAKVRGVIAMPEELFKTSGKGGTHAKVCVVLIENTPPADDETWPVFMADAKWCGHDSRANPTIRKDEDGNEVLLDDVPLIAERFKELFPRHEDFWGN